MYRLRQSIVNVSKYLEPVYARRISLTPTGKHQNRSVESLAALCVWVNHLMLKEMYRFLYLGVYYLRLVLEASLTGEYGGLFFSFKIQHFIRPCVFVLRLCSGYNYLIRFVFHRCSPAFFFGWAYLCCAIWFVIRTLPSSCRGYTSECNTISRCFASVA